MEQLTLLRLAYCVSAVSAQIIAKSRKALSQLTVALLGGGLVP
jgi:hypothetical protein